MQRALTRRLSALLLIPVLCIASAQLAAEAQNSLGSEESEKYLKEIKALYLTSSERDALLVHSNTMLATYALRAGYQVGRAEPQDIRYFLSLGAPGELRIREERRRPGEVIAVSNRSLLVFGVDPYLQYECPPQGIECLVKNPADGSTWLTIVRDPKGAQELAKSLSFLLRNMQKG